ncbi:MAG: hypothetical protein VXY99_03140, partial [Pseudomonadota bacterium]|nr:hypothetical protein [Pseudomonadota bacterium]
YIEKIDVQGGNDMPNHKKQKRAISRRSHCFNRHSSHQARESHWGCLSKWIDHSFLTAASI